MKLKQGSITMKKIMFNDKFLLTKAVLDGRKTQTRRMITYPKRFKGKDVCGYYIYKRVTDGVITEVCMYDEDERSIDEGQILPKYEVGEVVAVAQAYHDCGGLNEKGVPRWDIIAQSVGATNAGWSNKMFVRADLMPHQIHIIDVRVERLQDITDECCLKEGIIKGRCGSEDTHFMDAYYCPTDSQPYCEPREAFAHLINKVSRKDVWSENPYVFVYDFALIK